MSLEGIESRGEKISQAWRFGNTRLWNCYSKMQHCKKCVGNRLKTGFLIRIYGSNSTTVLPGSNVSVCQFSGFLSLSRVPDHYSSSNQQFVVKMGISSRSFQARTCAGFSQTAAVHYCDEIQAKSQVLQSRISHVYVTSNMGWGNGNSGCWVGARLQVDSTIFCLLVTYILEYCIFRSVFSEVCHPFRHVYRLIKHPDLSSMDSEILPKHWEFCATVNF